MADSREDLLPTNVADIWKGMYSGKFYFRDEAEMENGPYDTLELAEAALNEYVAWLNTPPAVNKTSNLPQCNVKYYGG